jgi:hypothetical protein
VKILWVFAHPEQSSLNGSLLKEGLRIRRTLAAHFVTDLVLRPELAPGLAGIAVHYRDQ